MAQYPLLVALLGAALLASCTHAPLGGNDVLDTDLIVLGEREVTCAQSAYLGIEEYLKDYPGMHELPVSDLSKMWILTDAQCDRTEMKGWEAEDDAATPVIGSVSQVQGMGRCGYAKALLSSDSAHAGLASCGDVYYHEAFYNGLLRDVCVKVGDEVVFSEKRFFAGGEGAPGPGSCRWLSPEEIAHDFARASAISAG